MLHDGASGWSLPLSPTRALRDKVPTLHVALPGVLLLLCYCKTDTLPAMNWSSVIHHQWTNVVKLASKHMRVASQETKTSLACWVYGNIHVALHNPPSSGCSGTLHTLRRHSRVSWQQLLPSQHCLPVVLFYPLLLLLQPSNPASRCLTPASHCLHH